MQSKIIEVKHAKIVVALKDIFHRARHEQMGLIEQTIRNKRSQKSEH